MTVTEAARDLLRAYIAGYYTRMDIGEGGGSTDITLTALDSSITTAVYSNITTKLDAPPTSSSSNQLEYSATVSGTTFAGYTIREVGIFNAAGDAMLTRIPIDPIGPLENTKEYQIKVIIEVE